MKEIQNLCDQENQKTTLVTGKDKVKKLSLEIGHIDRRFVPNYVHETLLQLDDNYRKEH
jgi:hypothetical protein